MSENSSKYKMLANKNKDIHKTKLIEKNISKRNSCYIPKNELDSHCSSIGKYVIGSHGISQWGIKVNYVLVGKDATNSNAVKRAIVLHSWEKISSEEVYPEGAPEGWGCPAVSNESMKEIDVLLKANKNMLMWIIK
jgi:hypothetical protein